MTSGLETEQVYSYNPRAHTELAAEKSEPPKDFVTSVMSTSFQDFMYNVYGSYTTTATFSFCSTGLFLDIAPS